MTLFGNYTDREFCKTSYISCRIIYKNRFSYQKHDAPPRHKLWFDEALVLWMLKIAFIHTPKCVVFCFSNLDIKSKMIKKYFDEYCILTDKLEEINWTIYGKCNDIDCDKYMYKDLLKKRYHPVLEHNFSCMEKLRRDKSTIMKMLSDKKYKRHRYKKCAVCKKSLDKLNEKNIIVSFTRPSDKGSCQWNGVWTHKNCSSKVKVPRGWNLS